MMWMYPAVTRKTVICVFSKYDGSLVRRWPVLGRINEVKMRQARFLNAAGLSFQEPCLPHLDLVDAAENGPTTHEAPIIFDTIADHSFLCNRKENQRVLRAAPCHACIVCDVT